MAYFGLFYYYLGGIDSTTRKASDGYESIHLDLYAAAHYHMYTISPDKRFPELAATDTVPHAVGVELGNCEEDDM